MQRVLVIGERPDEVKALAVRLDLLGCQATPSANDLTLALRSLFAFKPEIIILDVSSARDSRELFQLLSEVSQLPIIIVGDGRNTEALVRYLEEGAVDYLPKPVSPTLLVARIRAIARRTAYDTPGGTIRVGTLEVDRDRHVVRKDGQAIAVTPTEFKLLHVLGENAGRACSHRMLLERVWGEDFRQCAHYLRLYIGYLRQKIEDDPRSPRLLVTEWGVGYRLVATGQPSAAPAMHPSGLAVA